MTPARGGVGPRAAGTVEGVGKARDWLQQERRKTLGDWVAFCVGCGHTQRYFEESADEVPRVCPGCGGEVRADCPSCGARFPSAFLVSCGACGAPVRDAELFGTPIRRDGA